MIQNDFRVSFTLKTGISSSLSNSSSCPEATSGVTDGSTLGLRDSVHFFYVFSSFVRRIPAVS